MSRKRPCARARARATDIVSKWRVVEGVRIDKCRSAREKNREYERTRERKEQAIESANADEQERVWEKRK